MELSHVWFSYTPEQKLIRDFNLKVKPGQRVAIVGPTGCGKSNTRSSVRFYDPDQGQILVSGTDAREITRGSLRASYGMVLQETWLRTGTIRDNIRMGNPDASDEEIIAAAKATKAHSFIRRLSEGYDTVITEDGGSLSQGQKQLLCITRVMLCRPPMLILDEATSSIDTRTEIQVQNAFARLMEGRTSFIVAHPPVHHSGGRCDTGDAGGEYRRAGQPQPAAGTERILCSAVQQPVRRLKSGRTGCCTLLTQAGGNGYLAGWGMGISFGIGHR